MSEKWTPSGRCGLVVVDIAGFGNRARTDHVLRYVRNALHGLLSDSFDRCGTSLDNCYVEDRGDGVIIVVPPKVHTSVLASGLIDWLRAGLRRHNEVSSEIARIRLRVGLHTGEIHTDDHGIVGAAVNHVFRLLDAPALRRALIDSTAGLALIVSDQVYEDVIRHAPDLVDPAEFQQAEVRVKETVTRGWIRTPGLALVPADGAPAERSLAGHLPSARPVTSFVGRQHELRQLRDLLKESRLVTLVGPGGTGKTRLAVEMLRDLDKNADPICSDGAHVVDLTSYQAGDDLCRALLTALQLATRSSYTPPQRGPAEDALVAALVNRQVLLVLDNCEQLLDDVAAVADALLSRTDGTVLLATSREPLGVAGETTFQVGPLAVPPATQLFADRARAADPAFVLSAEIRVAVADICRRLDGLPLPIELAAARVRALTPAQIADLLADKFQLLGGGSRTNPRHRTLQAVVDWSYDLLDEPAREAFAYLSIFRGGFQLSAARELGARLGIRPVVMTDFVVRLVDKSLLQASLGENEAMRYRMLETLREYGTARLGERGRAEEVGRRHAELYMELAEQQGAALRTAGQGCAIRTLEREDDNLRAAFEFGCRSGQHELVLRLVDALGSYLWMRGERVFGWPGLLRALNIRADEQDPMRRARALIWTCHLGAVATTEPEARGHGQQARVILERLGLTHVPEYAFCLFVEAFACYRENDHQEGNEWISRSLALATKLDDPWLLGCGSVVAGIGHTMRGEFAAAELRLHASVRYYRAVGDAWGEHRAQIWLSRMHESVGNLAKAQEAAEAALALVRSLDLGEATALLVGWIARLQMLRGDECAASATLAAVERTHWWRSSPEAVAWMSECEALRAEYRARTQSGDQRAAALRQAANHYGEAADGLGKVGLLVHAVSSRCRQAVMLAESGQSAKETLAAAAYEADSQPDSRAQVLVLDATADVERIRAGGR